MVLPLPSRWIKGAAPAQTPACLLSGIRSYSTTMSKTNSRDPSATKAPGPGYLLTGCASPVSTDQLTGKNKVKLCHITVVKRSAILHLLWKSGKSDYNNPVDCRGWTKPWKRVQFSNFCPNPLRLPPQSTQEKRKIVSCISFISRK